jgi:hypothetical protein
MPHVDDLIKPRPKQILFTRSFLAAWPHRSPPDAVRESQIVLRRNPKNAAQYCKLSSFNRHILANQATSISSQTPKPQRSLSFLTDD